MQPFVQPLLQSPRIFIQLLCPGNAAKVEPQFAHK
jgi:hypothetical protein